MNRPTGWNKATCIVWQQHTLLSLSVLLAPVHIRHNTCLFDSVCFRYCETPFSLERKGLDYVKYHVDLTL